MHASTHAIELNAQTLHNWPLPMPSGNADKEARGSLLIIGGSSETPGALILAAMAALRAGVGKLALAAGASIAQQIAMVIPEARVIALPETEQGGITLDAVDAILPLRAKLDAILIGPGMQDETAIAASVQRLLADFGDTKLILDACAMGIVRQSAVKRDDVPDFVDGSDLALQDTVDAQSEVRNIASWRFPRPVLLTPHAGEMAHLTGVDKEALLADQGQAALDAARRWNAIVAFKAAATWIGTPDGTLRCHENGSAGLATSGSGDTLAGIIAGLAARGASLEQACAWGVVLHAQAGKRLAQRVGPLGFLAREIPEEIPALLQALCGEMAE